MSVVFPFFPSGAREAADEQEEQEERPESVQGELTSPFTSPPHSLAPLLFSSLSAHPLLSSLYLTSSSLLPSSTPPLSVSSYPLCVLPLPTPQSLGSSSSLLFILSSSLLFSLSSLF